MNQKDYLKKYLSIDKEKKKSKKRKRNDIKGSLKIIDDAVVCEEVGPNFEYDEDAPTIAETTCESSPTSKFISISQEKTSNPARIISQSEVIKETGAQNMTVMQRRRLMKTKKLTPEEEARNEREAVLQKTVNEKHNRWRQGVKQTENWMQQVQDYSVEAAKEFARHRSDVDLNDRLKNVDREEDPMLDYIKRERRKKETTHMPTYKGSYPPNRYNIRPGYRWDGVDRSNGYEKRFFEKQNSRKADEEEMYKWSVEDM